MGKISKDRLFELKNQIKMAEAINNQELKPIMKEAIERYTGKHVPVFAGGWDIILNEIYPIIQNSMPSIFFRNPRAFLKPRQKTFISKQFNPATGKKEPIELESQKSATTQEALLNYSLEEIKYKRETRKVLMDALLFPHGVLWHGYKGDFGMTEEQSMFIQDDNVFVKRISPLCFLKDPNVNMSNVDEGQWVARVIDIPYLDFMEDDKLNIDKKVTKGFKGYGDQLRDQGKDASTISRSVLDYADEKFKESNHSRFVRCYEVFLRPTKKEKRNGEKGHVLLLNFEQVECLRDDDWVIKAKGFPAKILQFNELNDSMIGLADIDTYKSIADQKNVIVNLQLRNAQENSKVYVALATDDQDEESIERIQKGDQTIILFKGDTVNGKMSVASGGGQASSELYLIDGRIQKNLEDKSGMTDQRRGFLQSGEESAASAQIRAAGAAVRPAYRQDIMTDFIKESFLYTLQMLKQFMPIKDAVRIIGSLDLQWSDNPTLEDIQADVDVEIDAISMLPENPMDEFSKFERVLTLMTNALTNPAILDKITKEGKTMNLSPMIEQMLLRLKIKNPDVFRNIKPEESQGYVSVQQIREAKSNIQSALTGQPIQYPPQMADDHVAKLETYTTIQALLKQNGQMSQVLDQLIQVQSALLQEVESKQASTGLRLKKPQTVTT